MRELYLVRNVLKNTERALYLDGYIIKNTESFGVRHLLHTVVLVIITVVMILVIVVFDKVDVFV